MTGENVTDKVHQSGTLPFHSFYGFCPEMHGVVPLCQCVHLVCVKFQGKTHKSYGMAMYRIDELCQLHFLPSCKGFFPEI